jgi:hypothetical protein
MFLETSIHPSARGAHDHFHFAIFFRGREMTTKKQAKDKTHKKWKFRNGFTDDWVHIDNTKLFDADAFVQYVERDLERGYAVSKPQEGTRSNSHYFNVEVMDENGKPELEFTLMVSDHTARGHYNGSGSPPDVTYSEMPAASEYHEFDADKTILSEKGNRMRGLFVPLANKSGLWNNKSDWDAVIREMDQCVKRMKERIKELKEDESL